MTQEWMLRALLDFGFKQQDAEVYVFLTLNGSQNVKTITIALKAHKRRIYRALNRLRQNRLVTATLDLPAQFTAVPFDKVLDLLMKANLKEAERIERRKDKILSLWNSNIKMI